MGYVQENIKVSLVQKKNHSLGIFFPFSPGPILNYMAKNKAGIHVLPCDVNSVGYYLGTLALAFCLRSCTVKLMIMANVMALCNCKGLLTVNGRLMVSCYPALSVCVNQVTDFTE